MAAREVVVRMKKNVSSKCPAVTSVLTVPLSSPPPKPLAESGPPSPQVATAAQGCLTVTLGTRPWLSSVIISNQDQISAYQAYIFLISVLELF